MTWAPAPSTAIVSSTGTTRGAGKITSASMNALGTPAENSPYDAEPAWVPAPKLGSAGGTVGYAT